MVGLTAKNTWKKKTNRKKKMTNVRPRKVKVSIHSHENQCKWHTGRYEKCVNLTNNHPRETPPHKKSMPVTQHFQPHCEDSPESTEAQLSAEFPWRWRHTCSNFLPRERERESRLPEWNTNQQVDIEGFLHLYSPVLFLFTITS